MTFLKKIKLAAAIAIVFSIVFSIVSFAVTSENIRQNVLRLHVIAASDSEEDQSLKLKVRDAVLKEGGSIFDGSVNIENAVEKITPKISTLEKTAKNIVRENGFNYKVKVTLARDFFPTRTYEKVTLPAGKYLAVRVVIDEGKGHNWWCVMFPTLCLPAAKESVSVEDVLGESGARLVNKNPRYEPRFKIIEMIEEFKEKISK